MTHIILVRSDASCVRIVVVPSTLSNKPLQTFQAFTADIQRMADWFRTIGVETVAIESTGIYWVPVFEVL